jgi:hypothetical protein
MWVLWGKKTRKDDEKSETPRCCGRYQGTGSGIGEERFERDK